jgi:scyllo-inositol 2-dehydrogenase (NAD+)
MKKQIRCAVLGLGRLGSWHAENLSSKVPGAELVIVADPGEKIAEKVARNLGVKKWTNNPKEVFEDADIDAVIIATPTSTHGDLIKKAIAAGKHIFVEKPITQDLNEATEIVELLKNSEVFCQVGFMRRYDPAYAEAKRRIMAGEIGKPIYFKGVSRDPEAPSPEYVKNSGGMFLDMSIHDYDIARFLMDSEVKSVVANGSVLVNPFMSDFNDVDQSVTYLTFESGAAGDIEGSRNAHYGYDIRGEVIGTEGTIIIGSIKDHDIQVLTKKGNTHDIIPDFPKRFKEAYVLEMIDFIDSLRNNTKPKVTEIDGKAALEIAIKAKESFETGQQVYMDSNDKILI